jgi:transcriptional regulator with XRE-family HTH domain
MKLKARLARVDRQWQILMLKELKRFGYSQNGLARALQISPRTVGTWFRGERGIPPRFEATIRYFLGFSGSPRPKAIQSDDPISGSMHSSISQVADMERQISARSELIRVHSDNSSDSRFMGYTTFKTRRNGSLCHRPVLNKIKP